MHYLIKVGRLIKYACIEFWADDALRMSATLSYYILFALPPVLMILLSFISVLVPNQTAYTTLITEITNIIGPSFAQAIHPYSSHINQLVSQSITARYSGVLLLLLALYAVINQLTYSLNRVWEIAPRTGQPLFFHFKQRFFSVIFILILGVLMAISFIVHLGVDLLVFHTTGYITVPHEVIQGLNASITFISVWVLISAIYRLLPDGSMAWKDIVIGGFITSLLFVLGKYLIGILLSNSILISIYGIMGSVLILLLWIYYSCLIFFFGAEFTQVYANSHGSGISFDPRYTISLQTSTSKKKIIN